MTTKRMVISETMTLHIIQITTRDSSQSGAGGGGLHALPNVTSVTEGTTIFLSAGPLYTQIKAYYKPE
jgi:hypothetical protein